MAEIPDVQNPVMIYARSKGWKTRRMEYLGRVGCPDTWFLKAGRWIIVEFKDLGEEPNIMQQREHKRLRDGGAEVYVIDNYEDGCALFD